MDMDLMQHEGHEGHDGGDEASCPMIMTFHTGNCESILFKSLTVRTGGEFAVAVIIIFIVAVAYEGLRFWREKLHSDYTSQNAQSCSNPKEGGSVNTKTIRQLLTHKIHLTQTLMHLIQVTVSYALMLIVMTFNVWLVLAIILGATVGFFFFGWIRQRSIDVAENCCH